MVQVLIAEDEAFTAMALVDGLADRGHTVKDAADGAIAIVILDNFKADVIVTDLMMPNLSGAELIRYLDARPGPRVPVILISGVPETKLPADLRYDGYLGKPVDHEALGGLVERLASSQAK